MTKYYMPKVLLADVARDFQYLMSPTNRQAAAVTSYLWSDKSLMA
jgi:hypothetical protein